MRFNEMLLNSWLPLLVGLVAGTLLGWLVLSPTFSPVHTTQGGPRNLQGRHLDTLVSGLMPYVEEVNSGGDEETREDAFNKIGTSLCYPVEDYTAVQARRDSLDAQREVNPDAPFTLLQYDVVLDTFDDVITCEAYRELNKDAVFNEGDTFGAGRWIVLLLFIGAILGIGALLLSSRGISLSNLNRPSTKQRQRRPRFNLDRDDEGRDGDKGRDRSMDVPRYSRTAEPEAEPERERIPYDSRETENRAVESPPQDELIPPAPDPAIRPPRRYESEAVQDAPEPEPEPEIEPIVSDDTGFTATYSRGDEAFERVFEIYGTDNQYLGDCSIEVADSLGSDPADVTAFKIRLFEAGTPRSITKLIMSEHAFNDRALKARLSTQGDAVLAQMGEPLTLEGGSITVDTYLTDLLYSNDSGQPVRSVFDRVTVKLKAFVNRPEDADDGSNILEF